MNNNNNAEENKKIDERFQELRKSHKNLKIDREIEDYMSNLRDIGEYNRWSLRLTQRWMKDFYHDKFWVKMGVSMLKYNKVLNPEDIQLDVCNEFLEGYYFPKENKITLCANSLTNYEKPYKFHKAIKRLVLINFLK
jgi:hypothetical protein